jgi:hypothetical protein
MRESNYVISVAEKPREWTVGAKELPKAKGT